MLVFHLIFKSFIFKIKICLFFIWFSKVSFLKSKYACFSSYFQRFLFLKLKYACFSFDFLKFLFLNQNMLVSHLIFKIKIKILPDLGWFWEAQVLLDAPTGSMQSEKCQSEYYQNYHSEVYIEHYQHYHWLSIQNICKIDAPTGSRQSEKWSWFIDNNQSEDYQDYHWLSMIISLQYMLQQWW